MTTGWVEQNNSLYRKFEFANFAEAFAFMTEVARLAEEKDHHPDWSNSWNIVEINLCSHDKGRTVTERDHRLAESINAMLKEGTK
jgi:4a-hydroxytetrahydrobiopterin dehydratase